MSIIVKLDSVNVKYRQRLSLFRHSHFHALKDVSFEIYKGETLGIIGRNGCGKSTLLKLLAGIFKPDGGKVVRGNSKISLLTLSAGFDHNLSGFDNAIISAMMLGHKKSDVLAKLEEVIAYSELEDFIFEPVKTYSSGMRARLGFSIAVQMEADVLLIDEVLGVGDANFKNKAEATMLDKINSDQTVVLVSHSASQIKRVCQRAIWIEKGEIVQVGKCADVADAYQEFLNRHKNS